VEIFRGPAISEADAEAAALGHDLVREVEITPEIGAVLQL
jgi:hypothetical protein